MSNGPDSPSSRLPLVLSGLLGLLLAIGLAWSLGTDADQLGEPGIPVRDRSPEPVPTVAPRVDVGSPTEAPSPDEPVEADLPLVTQINAIAADHLDVFYADCIDAVLQPGESVVNAREVAPGVYGPFQVVSPDGTLYSTALSTEDGPAPAWIEIAWSASSHTASCIRHDERVSHALPPLPDDTFQVVRYGKGCPLQIWSLDDAPATVQLVPGSCGVNINRTDGSTEYWVSSGDRLIPEERDPVPWEQPDGPTMAEHYAEREATWLDAVNDERNDPASRALLEELARERFEHFEDLKWRNHKRRTEAIHQAEHKAGLPLSTPKPAPVDRSEQRRAERE